MAFVLPEWEMEGILVRHPELLRPGGDIGKVEVVAQQYYLPRSGGHIDILCRIPEGLLAVELKNEFVDDSHVITQQLAKYVSELRDFSDHALTVRGLIVSTHGFSRNVEDVAGARAVTLQTIPVITLLEKASHTDSSVDVKSSARARLLQRRLGLASLATATELLRREPPDALCSEVKSIDHFLETGRHDEDASSRLGRILSELSSRSPIMAHEVLAGVQGSPLTSDAEKWFWLFYSVLDRRANAAAFVKAREALEECGLFSPAHIVSLVRESSYDQAIGRLAQVLRDSGFPLASDSVRRELAMPSSIADAALYLSRFDFSVDRMFDHFAQAGASATKLAASIMADLRKHIYGVGPRIAAQIVRGYCLKAGWEANLSSSEHLERCGFNETFAGPARLGLVSSPDTYDTDLRSFVDRHLGGNCGEMSHALWVIPKRFCLRPKRCNECPVAGFCNHLRSELLSRREPRPVNPQLKSPPAKPGAYGLLAPQGGLFMSPLKGTCPGSRA